MPKPNFNEPNEAAALSMEDFIRQHEYKGGTAEETIERSLNEYLINVYGKDLYGFTNQEFTGVRREAEEVIFGSGDDGQYYQTNREFLNSLRFTDALRGGEAFYLAAISENGELDKENPKVVKCMVYQGKEHLLIMSAGEMLRAEANLDRVSKPTFWQRLADGFLKIFGSRSAACLEYENFMKHMTTTLSDMRTGWQRVHTAEIAKNAHRTEQKILAEKRLVLPEYTRTAQKHIKRNMTAAEFDSLLQLMVGEGTHHLGEIALAYTVRLNHDALVARALAIPAEELLDKAEEAEDREAFLLENMDAFLLLIRDLEKEVRKVDLSAVDELTTMQPHVELESGQEAQQALTELLVALDNNMTNLCDVYRIEQEKQKQLEEERRQKELKRLEEEKRREENRAYYEEQDRMIEEAKRRRAEALAKNPWGEDKLEFYMGDYKPEEEFVVPRASAFLKNNKAAGDFPAEEIIGSDFPPENSFGGDFPKESNFGSDFPEEDNFGGMNNANTNRQSDFNPDSFTMKNNQQQIVNPFEDHFGDAPQTNQQTIINPFDDGPKATIANPFDDPFGANPYSDPSQTSQQPIANSFDDPFAANPYSDPSQTSQQPIANSFDDPFGDPFAANPYSDAPRTSRLQKANPFDDAPETSRNSNPFGKPFDNIPKTRTNPDPFANPFNDAPKQKQEPQIGGMGRR